MFNDCDLDSSGSISARVCDNHETNFQCGRQMLLKLLQRLNARTVTLTR
jgi:hypothetical protein